MEVRGQAKEIDVPNSIGYDPSFIQESSQAKLVSSPIGSNSNVHGRNSTILVCNQTLDPDPDPDTVSVQETTSGSKNWVRYRECRKNHAASRGGHVFDGCGEFMPNGEEETPEALKCAACECHRSFHRKETDGETQPVANYHGHHIGNNGFTHHTSIHPHPHPHPYPSPPSLPQAPTIQHHNYAHGSTSTHLAPIMMAFGGNGGAPAESSSEDLNNMYHSNLGSQGVPLQQSHSKSNKRFRTRFTQEQKAKMHELAEKLEWKIQKKDEQELQQFCNEAGVKRNTFKVWMHNNKQAMKKKQM